ncbi:MAG: lipoyl(octanoyl) transferase LipB [Candidatus Zapsychrus exili]|nr:lipoyl(octanoyl) transferase LipB [Candidatus Zapsychrus exili]
MEIKEKQKALQIKNLGVISYKQAYEIQMECLERVSLGELDTLILCEHPTVLTLGRTSDEENILVSKEELEKNNILVEFINRGGDITLHSTGQLVAYPILNLKHFDKDLKLYLKRIEKVAIDLLGCFGIVASRLSGSTGVWVNDKKIASIGIGVRKWITFHGIAININTNLDLFSMIRPCGMDVQMTSMADIKGEFIDINKTKNSFIDNFCSIFNF